MSDLKLDNTYRSTLHLCKRKYYLTKELGLIPGRGSSALRYGSTWHGFIEGFYSHVKEHGWAGDGKAIRQAGEYGAAIWNHETKAFGQTFDETDYRTLENCAISFLEYCSEFQHDYNMLKVIETEQMFCHPIELTRGEARLFPELAYLDLFFTGRLDVQVELSGMPWILEAKSTGQSISVQANRLHRSPQIVGYSYAGKHALDFPAEGCMVALHQLSSRRKKDGGWGTMTRAYQRIPHIFTDEDLDAWRLSYLSTASELVRQQEMDVWPMQFDSCYQFGRCQFGNICEKNQPLKYLVNDMEDGYIPDGFLVNKKNFLDFSTKGLIEKLRKESERSSMEGQDA